MLELINNPSIPYDTLVVELKISRRTVSVKHFRWAIRTHQAGAKNYERYTEANLWYVNYLAFMKELNPAQKEFIKIKENGHIPPYSLITGFDINFIYEKWLEIVANSKLNQLVEITNN